MGFGMFDAGFTVFQIMFFLVFGIVLFVFISSAVTGLRRWNRNNQSPRLTVPASVVAKRTQVGHRGGGVEDHHHYGYTSYFVTFQVESGDRMELQVDGPQSGLLVEGDQGLLSFQGTRFLGFERRNAC